MGYDSRVPEIEISMGKEMEMQNNAEVEQGVVATKTKGHIGRCRAQDRAGQKEEVFQARVRIDHMDEVDRIVEFVDRQESIRAKQAR